MRQPVNPLEQPAYPIPETIHPKWPPPYRIGELIADDAEWIEHNALSLVPKLQLGHE